MNIDELSNPSIPALESVANKNYNVETQPIRYNGVRTDIFPNNTTTPVEPAARHDAPFWNSQNIKLDGMLATNIPLSPKSKVQCNPPFVPFLGLLSTTERLHTGAPRHIPGFYHT